MELRQVIGRLSRQGQPESSQSALLQYVSPVLSELGWDVFDPERVKLDSEEFSEGGAMTTFWLPAFVGQPSVFVCVTFGKLPASELEKLHDLPYDETDISIETDGVCWRFYAGLDERRHQMWLLEEVDFRNDGREDSASILERYLLRKNLEDGSTLQALEHRFDELKTADLLRGELPVIWRDLLQEPDQMLTELLQEEAQRALDRKIDIEAVAEFLRGLVDEETSGTEDNTESVLRCRQPRDVTGRTPIKVHILGATIRATTWFTVFEAVIEAVYERHADAFESTKTLRGRTVQYILHKDALSDLAPKKRQRYAQLGTSPYWFHKNASAEQFYQRCRVLLEHFGYNGWNAEVFCVELWNSE